MTLVFLEFLAHKFTPYSYYLSKENRIRPAFAHNFPWYACYDAQGIIRTPNWDNPYYEVLNFIACQLYNHDGNPDLSLVEIDELGMYVYRRPGYPLVDETRFDSSRAIVSK